MDKHIKSFSLEDIEINVSGEKLNMYEIAPGTTAIDFTTLATDFSDKIDKIDELIVSEIEKKK